MNAPKIIFEDEDLIVLDKPAGITVNKSETTVNEQTVQDWISDKFQIFNSQFSREEDFYKRAGIVHRLDRETSGILLVAKNPESFIKLQRQFKEKTVKKSYTALVHGQIDIPEGEINVPVGRLPWNRKQFGVVAGGRESVTKYKVLKHYKDLTLVRLYPETGRTHQIRVHLKHIGHPIFSDFLYGGRKTAREDRKLLPRVFLHASKIQFSHPKTGEKVEFESPLPLELAQFIINMEVK